ncbi:unnamed protein product [Miscanthus lutarioriparius]|uniref:Uncharacterized protein n=1 Tax=Miscanthus lutarioriparius TaxID=422564 RepID=A0A811PS47_9POAL|nr:unnamed protein product [Miscanthus lutarioriparius]
MNFGNNGILSRTLDQAAQGSQGTLVCTNGYNVTAVLHLTLTTFCLAAPYHVPCSGAPVPWHERSPVVDRRFQLQTMACAKRGTGGGSTSGAHGIILFHTGHLQQCLQRLQPIFPGESVVEQLVEIIKVLGTPTREEIQCMNRNYTVFGFPQIKAHPWPKFTIILLLRHMVTVGAANQFAFSLLTLSDQSRY